MKLGIMQPYFFPYIGYFQLMNAVDRWVAFDEVQFIDKGWINRNRILHSDPAKEWQFITLPLDKRGQFDRICDINIKESIDWRSQILGKLTHYKKSAPYYEKTIEFVQNCFDTDESSLAKIVIEILRKTCAYIGIQTPIDVQSELKLQLSEIHHPGQWALRISQALNAEEYINPIGGRQIFKPKEFESVGVKLSFLKTEPSTYLQMRKKFISGLSIIDVLMFNDRQQCARLLEGYDLVQ